MRGVVRVDGRRSSARRPRRLHLRDCLAYPLALGDPTLAGRALIEQEGEWKGV
jgi:hypothetical protein